MAIHHRDHLPALLFEDRNGQRLGNSIVFGQQNAIAFFRETSSTAPLS